MAHVYWRLYITTSSGDAIAKWVPFDAIGTAIATTGGSASADDSAFGAAANAFDGNVNTFWSPSGGPPHWLEYQFPSAVEIASFTLATRNDGGWAGSVVDIDLQYSDNGSTWTTKYSYRGVYWSTGAGQVITFNAANALPALGIAWRLLINSSYTGGQVAIGDIVFRDGGGTAIATTQYAATASSTWGGDASHGAYAAFNGDGNTTYWQAASGLTTGWVAYRFASLVQVASFCITSPTGAGPVPSSVTLEYSFDETTWTSVGTFAPANSSSQQCFTLGATFPIPGTITASPSAGVQGNAYIVTITGTGTNFSAGVTAVSFSGSGGTVSGVSVSSATSLTFTLTLSGAAALGAKTITVTTGAEAPTATFTVISSSGPASNWGFVG